MKKELRKELIQWIVAAVLPDAGSKDRVRRDVRGLHENQRLQRGLL